MDLTLNAGNLESHLNGRSEASFYVPNLRKAFPSGNLELLKKSEGDSLYEKTETGAAFLHNNSIDQDTGQPYNIFIKKTSEKIKAYFKIPIANTKNNQYKLMAYCEARSIDSIKAKRKAIEKANQETLEDQQAKNVVEQLLEA